MPGNYEIEVEQDGFKLYKIHLKVGAAWTYALRITSLGGGRPDEEITATNLRAKESPDVADNGT